MIEVEICLKTTPVSISSVRERYPLICLPLLSLLSKPYSGRELVIRNVPCVVRSTRLNGLRIPLIV